jgi:hypothetical protein
LIFSPFLIKQKGNEESSERKTEWERRKKVRAQFWQSEKQNENEEKNQSPILTERETEWERRKKSEFNDRSRSHFRSDF